MKKQNESKRSRACEEGAKLGLKEDAARARVRVWVRVGVGFGPGVTFLLSTQAQNPTVFRAPHDPLCTSHFSGRLARRKVMIKVRNSVGATCLSYPGGLRVYISHTQVRCGPAMLCAR